MITQAFFSLLRNKKFEKISIQEIADAAMINRATFMHIMPTSKIFMTV